MHNGKTMLNGHTYQEFSKCIRAAIKLARTLMGQMLKQVMIEEHVMKFPNAQIFIFFKEAT